MDASQGLSWAKSKESRMVGLIMMGSHSAIPISSVSMKQKCELSSNTNNRQSKVIKSSRKQTLTIKLGTPDSEGTMDGSTLGCVEDIRDGRTDVLGDTLAHSSNDSASAIASKAWHSLLSSPLSQQFTVLDTPSGSTTVKLVTRGELFGANEGSLLSDG